MFFCIFSCSRYPKAIYSNEFQIWIDGSSVGNHVSHYILKARLHPALELKSTSSREAMSPERLRWFSSFSLPLSLCPFPSPPIPTCPAQNSCTGSYQMEVKGSDVYYLHRDIWWLKKLIWEMIGGSWVKVNTEKNQVNGAYWVWTLVLPTGLNLPLRGLQIQGHFSWTLSTSVSNHL